MSSFKIVLALGLTSVLAGCGGSDGFPPVITGVKVGSLIYGQTATIYLGGKDLRSNLTVESNNACTSPSINSNSTTETLVLNCTVKAVGDLPLTIKTDTGTVIYTANLTVPKPQVTFFTSKGTFTVELNPEIAPLTTNNFLTYVSKGFYANTLFHRVIPGFVVQAGGYTAGLVKKAGQFNPIELETNKGLSNVRGSLAMARTNLANSATSEFFINMVDNLFLNYQSPTNPGYAVFGSVVQGLDVLDAIAAEPTGVLSGFLDVPLTDVSISLALQTK